MTRRLGGHRYDRIAVAFLTVLLVIGSIARIIVLVLRPSAAERFHSRRRQILATRLEQTGDAVVLVIALSMVVFGYGHHPAGALVFLWTIALAERLRRGPCRPRHRSAITDSRTRP